MSENVDLTSLNTLRLQVGEKIEEVTGEEVAFPKYTTQILNIANRNAQGTRPAVVGQVSNLIQETSATSFAEWRKWYLKKHPDAIDKATDKVMAMLEKMRSAMDKIDRCMVKDYIEDLVITKTAQGLIMQEIILKELARLHNKKYRPAEPVEESKGIDGFIGEQPVSIKPHTFLSKPPSVRDAIDAEIVYYKKTAKYLYIFSNTLLPDKD